MVEGMGDGRGGLGAEKGFAEIFAALETDVLLLEGKVCWCACAICLKLKYTATHCNTLPHTATHCHALQHYLVCLGPMCSCSRRRCIYVLIQIATNYNILQHTATHCHALQYIVIHCNTTWCAWHWCALARGEGVFVCPYKSPQITTHCHALQPTATHRNTTWCARAWFARARGQGACVCSHKLPQIATHYSARHRHELQHTTNFCHALQRYLACLRIICSCSRARCVCAHTDCHTLTALQHAATHCLTLSRTATLLGAIETDVLFLEGKVCVFVDVCVYVCVSKQGGSLSSAFFDTHSKQTHTSSQKHTETHTYIPACARARARALKTQRPSHWRTQKPSH